MIVGFTALMRCTIYVNINILISKTNMLRQQDIGFTRHFLQVFDKDFSLTGSIGSKNVKNYTSCRSDTQCLRCQLKMLFQVQIVRGKHLPYQFIILKDNLHHLRLNIMECKNYTCWLVGVSPVWLGFALSLCALMWPLVRLCT